ncbi:hypothetical protein MKEN_00668500 [Mycena kentingensis (nom. inval.)]|nr:hypothetical protein MKEN_00668500 [Mycena kentingensis (nom. inval.)]
MSETRENAGARIVDQRQLALLFHLFDLNLLPALCGCPVSTVAKYRSTGAIMLPRGGAHSKRKRDSVHGTGVVAQGQAHGDGRGYAPGSVSYGRNEQPAPIRQPQPFQQWTSYGPNGHQHPQPPFQQPQPFQQWTSYGPNGHQHPQPPIQQPPIQQPPIQQPPVQRWTSYGPNGHQHPQPPIQQPPVQRWTSYGPNGHQHPQPPIQHPQPPIQHPQPLVQAPAGLASHRGSDAESRGESSRPDTTGDLYFPAFGAAPEDSSKGFALAHLATQRARLERQHTERMRAKWETFVGLQDESRRLEEQIAEEEARLDDEHAGLRSATREVAERMTASREVLVEALERTVGPGQGVNHSWVKD